MFSRKANTPTVSRNHLRTSCSLLLVGVLCSTFVEGCTFVSTDCTIRCVCRNDQITCNTNFTCSPNAECREDDGIRGCYCKECYEGDGATCTPVTPVTPIYTDCYEAKQACNTGDGVYTIRPSGWPGTPFPVFCDMTTDGGGWTVFQRRVNGSVDFNLGWSNYKEGFGNPSHEVWLGNEKLHQLSTQRNYELRIDLVDRNGVQYYAKYNLFSISNETNNYRLTLGTYSEGNAGDSLSYNNGRDFTTRDRDNDNSNVNCATEYGCLGTVTGCGNTKYQGAWWYSHCTYVALNDIYGACCMEWRRLPNNFYITSSEMKLRPI